jgi:hypothetical protein
MFKRAWLAGLAGVFAISAGVSAAKAETYNLSIVEGLCTGTSASCATNSPVFPNVGFVGFTGTWTSTLAGGGLNFNLPSGGLDTIGAFLATGTGSFSLTAQGGAQLTDILSAGNFTQATLFIFSGTVVGPSSGIITHDDGIGLFVNGVLITPPNDQNPTVAEMTAYSIGAGSIGQQARLLYVAANNLPEVLLSPNILGTPLPGTVWLFGAGLGGIAMLMRRRRRGMAAA